MQNSDLKEGKAYFLSVNLWQKRKLIDPPIPGVPRRGDLVTVRPSFFRLYTNMAAKEGSYHKETVDSVYNKLVCRKSEIDLLLTLFGDRGSFVSPSIFICGHTSTGKTVVVETLLKDLEVSMLFI